MIVNKSLKSQKIELLQQLSALALLTVSMALAGLLAAGEVPRLQTHYSVNQFLPENHPLIARDNRVSKDFFLEENQPILVILSLKKTSQSDWFQAERLSGLKAATEHLAEVPNVSRVLSLANIQGASESNNSVNVGSLASLSEGAELRTRVLADPIFTPLIISGDGRTTLFILSVRDLNTKLIADTVSAARTELLRNFGAEAEIKIGGVPAIQSELSDLLSREVVHFMGFALLASCLALLLVFSTWSTLLVPLIMIVLGNIFVLSGMAALGFHMTVLAVTVPILVAVTVLAMATHSMLRLSEEWLNSEKGSKAAILRHTLRELFLPNLLTALTTCFGFATLVLMRVPLIREFGLSVAVSVMISWATTVILMPPLLLLLPIPRARGWAMEKAQWTARIFRYKKVIVPTITVGAIILITLIQPLRWSARLFDDLPENQEARLTTERIDHQLGGMLPYEIVIRSDENDSWNDPTLLSEIDSLMKDWRKQKNVGSVIGLPDLLRQVSGQATLPNKRSGVAELFFLLSMSETSPLKMFLTPDGQATRLAVRLKDIPGDELAQLTAKLMAEVSARFPQMKVESAGLAATVHTLNDELSRELMEGFWQALGVISLLLLLVFRSWRWTLAAVLPNLLPAAVLVGVLGINGTPIKPGVALVFSIALGIAFNNTVFFLGRLRSLLNELGPGEGLVEKALALEGNPCLIASLCLLSGFFIFIFSYFSINQTFGFYMLISLFCGLIGDLVFLPALLSWMPWFLRLEDRPLHQLDNISLELSEMTMEEDMDLRKIAAMIVLSLFVPAAHAGSDPGTADQILKNVEKQIGSKDEAAELKMRITESNGSSKERDIMIKRKSGDKQQVLVRLESPADVRGIALLSVLNKGNEDQWLYLPSAKKARRVVSSNRSQKFLDSEFSIEDFSASTYLQFTNHVLRQEPSDMVVIESKAKSSETSYSRILTWVNQKNYQVDKSEYYDKEGKLLKKMKFHDYRKMNGATWRARTVEVQNVQNKRSTTLTIAKLKMNSGISDSEFTQAALEAD